VNLIGRTSDARSQEDELGVVAPVDRDVFDGPRGQRAAQIVGGRLTCGRLIACHFHLLPSSPVLERGIHAPR